MVLYEILLTMGSLVLVLGLLSSFLKKTIFSLPLLSLIAGIILSPCILNVLNPFEWGDTNVNIEETARLTLAIGLLGVALRLPRGYFKKQWKSPIILLFLGIPLMALSGGFIGILAVFTAGLSFDYIVGAKERAIEENVQEAVNRFFTLPIFGFWG